MTAAKGTLRVLLVSFRFPPAQSIGALRVGMVASELTKRGHEVHVLTVAADRDSRGGSLGCAVASVTATPWIGMRKSSRAAMHRQQQALQAAKTRGTVLDRNLGYRTLRWFRRNIVWLPDDYVGWLPFALAAGAELCRKRAFDVLYASAWPVSSLIAGSVIARRAAIPWIAELRDLWTGHHYHAARWHQAALNRLTEARVLQSAAGIVTVSHTLARTLQQQFHTPVLAMYTGYSTGSRTGMSVEASDKRLTVVYTGQLYQGRRDPTPVYQAVAALGGDASGIRLVFAGPDSADALAKARIAGLDTAISAFPELPHAESLKLQSEADVLLLLLWDTPLEVGVVTGKLFEYLCFDKPILVVGAPPRSEAAALVTNRSLGMSSRDPLVIARHLAAWRDEKAATGSVGLSPAADKSGLSRAEQAERLEDFLLQLCRR